MTQCPICHESAGFSSSGRDSKLVYCKNCGNMEITETALTTIRELSTEQRCILSHSVRKSQLVSSFVSNGPHIPVYDQQHRIVLHTGKIEAILDGSSLPYPDEQIDNLLLFIGQCSKAPGHIFWMAPRYLVAVSGAIDQSNVLWLFQALVSQKLVDSHGSPGDTKGVLTAEGWRMIAELRRGRANGRKAFMAMKFGDEAVDMAFRQILKPAAAAAGFDLQKLTDNPQAGLIDNRMRVEIKTSRFIIADLTHGNQGAYWEAGYGEGLGKRVFFTCEESYFEAHRTHFDTNHHHTDRWNLDHPQDSIEAIKATIRATLPDEAIMEDNSGSPLAN